MAAQYLVRRGKSGLWQYRRRVPADVADRDPRGEIRRATRTADIAKAATVAARINAELETYWSALGAGEVVAVAEGAERLELAVKLARSLGLAYRPAGDLARADLGEITRRLDVLERRGLASSPEAAAAVLGGVTKPRLTLGQLFSAYEGHVRDRLRNKSEDQLRKWRNPRLKAIRNLSTVLGDKALADLTRDDALDFRAWWLDRVTEEEMDPGSANKDIGQLAAMIRVMDEAWRLGLDNPFRGLRLRGAKHTPRTPYPPEMVRKEILPGHKLGGLNPEARAIVLMVAATGMRPSEIAALDAPRILLEAPIPHVQVRAGAREVKTRHAERDMPLAGVALAVMREHRDGFPRYRSNPDSLSAIANKVLGSAGLRPTPAHTVYSLRHTFKDRLIAIEAPPRVQDALMGHRVREIEYGAGPSLEQRAAWMARVWG